jgi:dihydroxyacetone kinase-like predicted kinase
MDNETTPVCCIEFVISGKDIDQIKLFNTLKEVGNSITVGIEIGGERKVHIHASDPKKVFDRTSRFGKPSYIKVDDLSIRSEAF